MVLQVLFPVSFSKLDPYSREVRRFPAKVRCRGGLTGWPRAFVCVTQAICSVRRWNRGGPSCVIHNSHLYWAPREEHMNSTLRTVLFGRDLIDVRISIALEYFSGHRSNLEYCSMGCGDRHRTVRSL